MKIKDLSDYKQSEVESLLRRIPIFKELHAHHSDQLRVLLTYSCIVELDPGEKIMRRGDKGGWLYFLIKGRLNVYLDTTENAAPLNHITPGELFGDLALLCEHKRQATVAADHSNKKTLLFAMDFKPFGALNDFKLIDMTTKLIFFRTMVHSIRWRLEVNRMQQPEHLLAAQLRKTPVYKGAAGSIAQLQSLFEQAQFLASILDQWNSDCAQVDDIMMVGMDKS